MNTLEAIEELDEYINDLENSLKEFELGDEGLMEEVWESLRKLKKVKDDLEVEEYEQQSI